MWGDGGARGGKGLIAVFRGVFASAGEIFILAGRAGHWAIILWGLDNFLMFPDFL